MVRVVFKNLEKSDMIRDIVGSKILHSLEKFPSLAKATATTIVSRDEARNKNGDEHFSVKLILAGNGIKPIIIEKSSNNLYQAVSIAADSAHEILHRASTRIRERTRLKQRRWKAKHYIPLELDWKWVG
jgi:ribosome-associated translation inhibitor RaiA